MSPVVNIQVPVNLNRLLIYPAIFLVFYFFAIKAPNQKIKKYEKNFLFFGLILLIYASLVSLFTTKFDPFFENFILLFCIAVSLSYLYFSKNLWGATYAFRIFQCLFGISITWALAIYLSIIFPEFREFMSLIFFRDYSRGAHLVDLRVPAFHPTGGDGSSLNQSFIALASVGYMMYFKGLKKFLIWALLLVSLSSTLFLARVGIIVGFPLFLILSSLTVRVSKKKIISIILLSFAFLIAGFFVFFDIPSQNSKEIIAILGHEHPYARMLRLVVGIQEGRAASGVLGTLFLDMVSLPSDAIQLIFGTGSYGRHLPSADLLSGTDIGYLRVINGIGLIGTILMFWIVWYGLFCCYTAQRSLNFWFSYIFLLSVFVAIGHIKIEYLNTMMASILLFLLFFVVSDRSSGMPQRSSSKFVKY